MYLVFGQNGGKRIKMKQRSWRIMFASSNRSFKSRASHAWSREGRHNSPLNIILQSSTTISTSWTSENHIFSHFRRIVFVRRLLSQTADNKSQTNMVHLSGSAQCEFCIFRAICLLLTIVEHYKLPW